MRASRVPHPVPNPGKAKLKLAAFIANTSGGDEVVAELGIFKGRPYRPNHKVHNLPARQYKRTLSEEEVRLIVPELCVFLANLVHYRSARWGEPVYDFNFKRPYGPCITLDSRDKALRQFFDEVESLNPIRDWRIMKAARVVNRGDFRDVVRCPEPWTPRQIATTRKGRKPKRKFISFPRSWIGAINLLAARDFAPLLRPHVLAQLAQRIKDWSKRDKSRNAKRFIELCLRQELITAVEYQATIGYLTKPFRRRLLPPQAETWDVLNKDDGVAVEFLRKIEDRYTIRLLERRVTRQKRKDANNGGRVNQQVRVLEVLNADGNEAPDWVTGNLDELIPHTMAD